jgi:hypothetical protein
MRLHLYHQKAKLMQLMLAILEISMKMIQKLSKSLSKIKRFIKIFLLQFLKGERSFVRSLCCCNGDDKKFIKHKQKNNFCRWQQEITDTVFDSVNQEADRLEKKNKAKKVARFYDEEKESDCIIQGYLKKRGHSFASSWQSKYAKLYPNR